MHTAVSTTLQVSALHRIANAVSLGTSAFRAAWLNCSDACMHTHLRVACNAAACNVARRRFHFRLTLTSVCLCCLSLWLCSPFAVDCIPLALLCACLDCLDFHALACSAAWPWLWFHSTVLSVFLVFHPFFSVTPFYGLSLCVQCCLALFLQQSVCCFFVSNSFILVVSIELETLRKWMLCSGNRSEWMNRFS